MPFITASLLANIGIHLTSSELELFNEQYEAELDKRIVDEIIDELAPDQINELIALKNAPSGELQAWLVKNVPDLEEIVEEEVAILLGEIAEHSDSINNA